MKYIHRSCLINWLKISKMDYCNICQFHLWILESISTIKHDGNKILVLKDICPKLEMVRSFIIEAAKVNGVFVKAIFKIDGQWVYERFSDEPPRIQQQYEQSWLQYERLGELIIKTMT
jgi:hypothetical protein